MRLDLGSHRNVTKFLARPDEWDLRHFMVPEIAQFEYLHKFKPPLPLVTERRFSMSGSDSDKHPRHARDI